MNDTPEPKPLPKTNTLPVHWKCGQCGKNARCEVPERARAVDIRLWMDSIVLPRVVKSHGILSPKCNPIAEKDGTRILTLALAFPVPEEGENGVLGQATEEQKEKARASGFPTETKQ